MDEHPWSRIAAEEPSRPLWLDPPTSPPLAESPAGPPPPLPPVPPNPLPRPDAAPPGSGGDGGRRRGGADWLKPAVAGAVVGALVAAAVAGGIVAANDDDDGASVRPAASVSRTSSRLGGDQLDVAGVLDAVEQGVVAVKVQIASNNPFRTGTIPAAGSGMLIDSSGLILTNAHVVEGASDIEVTLADGRDVPADLVGSMPSNDVALIRARNVSDLEPVKLGASSELQVGDAVVAVGNALNLGATPTVTTGIVSALNRSLDADNGEHLDGLIQTDAAINHGNSGGPLVNAKGEVIGINTAIVEGGENIGFALSIDTVKPLIEQLRNGGGEVRGGAFLGVSSADVADVVPAVRERFGVDREDGAFVTQVVAGSAAEAAGLQAGDVITGIDGQSVTSATDVGEVIQKHKPGDEVRVRIERDGESKTVTVTLGSRGVPQNGG